LLLHLRPGIAVLQPNY